MKPIRQTQKLIFFLFLLAVALSSNAQQSFGGRPLGLSENFQKRHGQLPLKARAVPAPGLQKLAEEDARNPGNPRFAAPIPVNFSLDNAGEWTELEDGSRLWRLKVHAEGALALAALYDEFYLPPGARLYMYSEDGRQQRGAYTFQSNRPSQKFLTGFIKGPTAIIEYYEPLAVRGQGRLHVFRMDYAYDKEKLSSFERELEPASLLNLGFGTSFDCHKNTACPEGAAWATQSRGICRVVMVLEEGTGYCTGSLVNNTAEDGRPFVLSAFHCQDGYTPIYDMWRFDFAYESAECPNPENEPTFNAVLGCERRAGRRENDFLLLEANSVLPSSYNLYFNGWNRQAGAPQSGAILHHPRGDIKKIAFYTEPATVYNGELMWSEQLTTPANHHIDVTYSDGTFEIGSSGSPLFDSEGLIRGQMHGGFNGCDEVTRAFFGRLHLSWEGGGTEATRLSDWLDPLGTGAEKLAGRAQQAAGDTRISGAVKNEEGVPVAGVKVFLQAPRLDTATTNAAGFYEFDGIPLGSVAGLSLAKEDDFQNGLSTFDLVFISKHILGVDYLDTPIKVMAADVNGSGGVTTLDQIRIRKVILGIDLDFGGRPAWQFFPAGYVFSDPLDPFQDAMPAVFMTGDISGEVKMDFTAVKTGDIDDSADTGR